MVESGPIECPRRRQDDGCERSGNTERPKVLTDWYRDAYRSFDIQPAAFNWRDTGSGTMDSGLNDLNGSHRNPDQRHEKP